MCPRRILSRSQHWHFFKRFSTFCKPQMSANNNAQWQWQYLYWCIWGTKKIGETSGERQNLQSNGNNEHNLEVQSSLWTSFLRYLGGLDPDRKTHSIDHSRLQIVAWCVQDNIGWDRSYIELQTANDCRWPSRKWNAPHAKPFSVQQTVQLSPNRKVRQPRSRQLQVLEECAASGQPFLEMTRQGVSSDT